MNQWFEGHAMSRPVEVVDEHLFKNMASDPRYKAFLHKMNLAE